MSTGLKFWSTLAIDVNVDVHWWTVELNAGNVPSALGWAAMVAAAAAAAA